MPARCRPGRLLLEVEEGRLFVLSNSYVFLLGTLNEVISGKEVLRIAGYHTLSL